MTKSGKHCGKRRNCTFCAISSFVTMFSKSRLLQRRQNASIWGKGLKYKLGKWIGVKISVVGGDDISTFWGIAAIFIKFKFERYKCTFFYREFLIFLFHPFPHTTNLQQKTIKRQSQRKEKLLIIRNFFYCSGVFNSCLLQLRQNASISWKGL